jgi:small subunit ribosomal protein S9
MATSSKPSKKLEYIHAVGRRKTAVARVRLYQKPGEISVNSQPIEAYFPGENNKLNYLEPVKLTQMIGKVSATIKVTGGGKRGQLTAVVHGLSRALAKADAVKYRPALKKGGFLTRDDRMRERRKVGTGGKARRQKQSPKR